MTYRYHLEQVMKKRVNEPFLTQDVDVNNDFEGNLRYMRVRVRCNFLFQF